LFSESHPELLELSHGTLMTCTLLGQPSLHLIDIKDILSVVGMVPHSLTLPSGVVENRFFVVEKSGLEIAHSGPEADDGDDNDGAEDGDGGGGDADD
ncbi:hypothetical protein PAXRUDRAFT_168111, partial [Paxillus rubicundulus Ve08.2h10]